MAAKSIFSMHMVKQVLKIYFYFCSANCLEEFTTLLFQDYYYQAKILIFSALHRCARDDNVQACRILLSYSVDTTIVSLQGYTASQLATENVTKILQGKFT